VRTNQTDDVHASHLSQRDKVTQSDVILEIGDRTPGSEPFFGTARKPGRFWKLVSMSLSTSANVLPSAIWEPASYNLFYGCIFALSKWQKAIVQPNHPLAD
jgi:hypothetical protein